MLDQFVHHQLMHERNGFEGPYHDLEPRYFIVVIPGNDIDRVYRNAIDHGLQFQHTRVGVDPLAQYTKLGL
jgi:hypothetical protein